MRLHGHTADEKFESVRKALERLSKKVSKGSRSVLVPAVPLNFYAGEVPEDNIVARYIFPSAGTLSKVVVFLPEIEVGKEVANLTTTVHTESETTTRGFTLKSRNFESEMRFEVRPGYRLVLESDKAPIWLGLIYELKPSGKEIKNAGISQDDRIEERTEAAEEGNS